MGLNTASIFEFTIDGWRNTAYIKSVEGGYPKLNTIEEQVGADNLFIKHGSTVEIDPISVEMGMQTGTEVLSWIQSSWRKEFSRHSGMITHANFDKKALVDHHFRDALLTEAAFPTLDASSKEAAFLKFKIQPEAVELKPASKSTVGQNLSPKQKMWTANSFSLKLDGLDVSKVAKIEGFTVKQGVKALYVGGQRFPQYEPTKITFPDLSVHISQIYAGSIMDWYENFVMKGKRDPSQEKQGAIEFLAPDHKTVIYRIKLTNVGIKSCMIERSASNDANTKKIKFDLYVGQMDIDGEGVLSMA
ncbi:MAG: phage tail protein [Deltaproteobacteria bacterium]|nr:phage tail protein [Deltaproteobacteria bacterium]